MSRGVVVMAVTENQAQRETAAVYALFRDIFRGGLAGLLAGILILGLGSRVVMRVVALLNPEAKGLITDNENVVGEITLDGTLEIVIFVGIFGGLAAGVVWVIVRDWLPAGLRQRIALGGLIAAATGSFLVIESDNKDFFELDQAEANIAMFVLLVGLTGGATALGDAMLDRRLPSGKLSGIVYGGLAALGGVFSLPVLANSFFFKDFCDCERTPWLAGAFLVLAAIATVAGWSGRFTELPARTGLALRALGTGGVAGATLLGAVFLAREIDRIL
ncbi:MAG TPA: hypothetical protein VII57_05230 [Dehalococcoidia bacterium]